jgi:hypothetical protein
MVSLCVLRTELVQVISDKTFTSSYENCCSNNWFDLVVKPTPGPKVDLLYIDFQYDDLDTEDARPQVFKLTQQKVLQ